MKQSSIVQIKCTLKLNGKQTLLLLVDEITENVMRILFAAVLRLKNIFFRTYSWSSLNYILPLVIFFFVFKEWSRTLSSEKILLFVKQIKDFFVSRNFFLENFIYYSMQRIMSGYLMYDCMLFSCQVYTIHKKKWTLEIWLEIMKTTWTEISDMKNFKDSVCDAHYK